MDNLTAAAGLGVVPKLEKRFSTRLTIESFSNI